METRGAVSLYSWYQQVKKKDLGVTRRDWLQHLRDEAKNKCQDKDKATVSRHTQEDIAQRERKIIEEQSKRERDIKHEVSTRYFASYQTKDDSMPIIGGENGKNIFENNPALQDDGGGRKTSLESIDECCLKVKKEGMAEGKMKLHASSPHTPIHEIKSCSMFLDTSFITPTFRLPEGDTGSPNVSDISLFSPTVPLADIVSPGRSAANTTREVAASLGSNLDGSVGSWSSALATPVSATKAGGPFHQTSPSTLERLTLHPKQGLRQNVLARSLFSPPTPGGNSSSTSEEWSPGLGIIKCHSPLPVFSAKIASAVSKRTRTSSEDIEKFLDYGTQGFTVSFDGNEESEKEEEKDIKKDDHPKNVDGEDTRLGKVEDICPQNVIPDTPEDLRVERPDKTSTPIMLQARTSLFAQHKVLSSDSPVSRSHTEVALVTRRDYDMNSGQDAEMMQISKKDMNLKDHIGITDMETSQSDTSESSYKLCQNPFDLICSPVKKVKPKNSTKIGSNHAKLKKTADIKDMNAVDDQSGKVVYDDKNIQKQDGEKHSHDTQNMEKVTDRYVTPTVDENNSENTDHIQKSDDFTHRKSPPEQNVYERNSSLNSEILGESAGEDKLEVYKLKEGLVAAKYQNIDNNQYTSGMKKIPEKSQLCSKSHISPSRPAPLFKRLPSCEKIDSDQECVKRETIETAERISPRLSEQSQTKSILNKLSLHKKKRQSGKFLYPTKPEEGYEKLNMKYTEVIGQMESNKSSVLVPDVSDSKLITSKIDSLPYKCATDIHTIANRQQNFLSLTNLEKDIRFETSLMPHKSETAVTYMGKEKENTSASTDQEVPVSFRKVCNVDKLHDRLRTPPVTSLSARSEAENTSAGSVIKLSKSQLHGSCGRIGKDKVSIRDANENDNNHDMNYKTLSFEQVHSKTTLGHKHSSDTQNRLSVDVRKNIEDGPQKEEEEEMLNYETQVVPEKEQTKEVLPISSLSDVHQCKAKHLDASQILKRDGSCQMMNDSLNDIDFSEIDLNVSIPVRDDNNAIKRSGIKQSTQGAHVTRHEIVCDTNDGFVENDDCIDSACNDEDFCGFVTGRGKQVKVSKDALEHAKKFLEELSNNEQTIAQNPPKEDESDDHENAVTETNLKVSIKDKNNHSLVLTCSQESSSSVCSFTTASGSKVTVNQTSMKRAEKLWEEEKTLINCNPDDIKVEMTDRAKYLNQDISKCNSGNGYDDRGQNPRFMGFKTGRGTAVKVGESSLKRAQAMWHEETRDHVVSNVFKGKSDDIQNSHKPSSHLDLEMHPIGTNVGQLSRTETTFGKISGIHGFTMASGAEVRISKEALRKAQLLWEENNKGIDAEEQENSGRHLLDSSKLGQSTKTCLGTRSEKQVSQRLEEASPMSEESAKKVEDTVSPAFVDISQVGFQRAQDKNQTENSRSHPGSNGVFMETLERNITRNVETGHTVDNIVPEKDQYNTMCSLQKDTDRNNIEVNTDENCEPLEGESFSGFQTAKGNRVSVNKEALMKAKKLWEESNNSEEKNTLALDSKRKSLLTKGSTFPGHLVGSPSSVTSAKESEGTVLSLRVETPQNIWQEPQPLRLSIAESSLMKLKDTSDGRIIKKEGKGRRISLSLSDGVKPGSMINREKRDIAEPSSPITNSKDFSNDRINCDAYNTQSTFPSFSTARGERFFVSEEALSRAKSMFDEDLPESVNREKLNMKTDVAVIGHKLVQGNESIKFQGFSTARGKKVHVSQDALERAQKLLNEETGDEKEIMIQQEKQVSNENGNFQSHTVYAVDTHRLETMSSSKVMDYNSISKGPKIADYGNALVSSMGSGSKVLLSESSVTKASEHSEKDRSLEETNARVPALFSGAIINTGNRVSEELKAGETFTEDLTNAVQFAPKEMGELDLSSYPLNVEVSKGDAISKTTKGTRQVLSGKDKLNVSEEEPKTQSLVDETKDTSSREAQFISCSTDVSTEQKGELPSLSSNTKGAISAGKSILVLEAVEPIEVGIESVTLKRETHEDECRSPSPILGSQKVKTHCRNLVGKLHGESYYNDMPVQPYFNMKRSEYEVDTMQSENVDLHSFKNLDSDNDLSTPVRKKRKFSDDHNFKHRLSAIISDGNDMNTLSSKTHSQPNLRTSRTDASLHFRVHSQPNSLGDCSKEEGDIRCKSRSTRSTDNQEISEITEAFLKDDPWEQEGAPESQATRRKWSQGSVGEEKDRSASFPKRRRMTAGDATSVDTRENADTQAVQTEWEMMRLKQIKEIKYKEKLSIQPIQGSLYKIRTEKKEKRRKLQSFGTLKVFSGGRGEVHKVNAKNSMQYRFHMKDERCRSVNCVDGCCVVPGADGCIGVEEIEQGFLAMPGVDPGLLPPAWVVNHYRWIVWKLAALERRLLNCEVLTLEGVIARLKYRYDREIDRAERPILRKITEQDDIPQKTMVLCVANIMSADGVAARVPSVEIRAQSPNGQTPMLELTDGWYSVGAIVDSAMTQLIHDGKVEVGTKLVIHGAELTGSSAACHPLEAPATLRLRLHTNMTRRARWWVRLGLLPQKGPLPSVIGTTISDGGLVGQMTVMLARVYPMVYFERSNGRAIFRGEKAHSRILKETRQQKENTMHQIVTEVEMEYSQETVESHEDSIDQLPMTEEEIRNLTMGRDIARLMDKTLDPCSLENLLTPHQVELARSWRQRQAEERRRNINAEVRRRLSKKQITYEATPLLRVRIVDCDGAGAMVTVWRPSEDLRQAFTEHAYFVIHYLMAAGYRNGSLQFTATRQTRWDQIKECPAINSLEFTRHVTPLCLMSSGELQPLWKEVDIVGVVLRVGQLDRGSQIVHIVDHHVNVLALMFWGGLKDCGVEDSVVIGSVISVLNGSWRGHRGGRFGCVHVTEQTIITISPRNLHLQEAATHLKESIKNMKTLLHEGDMKLDGQFDSRAFPAEPAFPTDARNETGKCLQVQMDEMKSRYDGTEDSKVTKTESGIDYRSHLNVEHDNVANPKLIRLEQRTREVRSKLKILGQYGTPSALRAIQSPSTTGARKPFRVPFKQLQKSDSLRDTSA